MNSTMRLLTPGDYRVMPWKNGGGTTTGIHIHPEGADWNEFDWRVGIADIAQSGPFSSFPGIDRSIMLLDCPAGSEMQLTIDGSVIDLPLQQFVDFAGESTAIGTLTGAPVRDFNVMSRRARIRHRCGFRVLAKGESLQLDDGAWHFVYLRSGEAEARAGDVKQTLSAGHSLVHSGGHPAFVVSGLSGCGAVWATFTTLESRLRSSG